MYKTNIGTAVAITNPKGKNPRIANQTPIQKAFNANLNADAERNKGIKENLSII
jgi:hypothetical protein